MDLARINFTFKLQIDPIVGPSIPNLSIERGPTVLVCVDCFKPFDQHRPKVHFIG